MQYAVSSTFNCPSTKRFTEVIPVAATIVTIPARLCTHSFDSFNFTVAR